MRTYLVASEKRAIPVLPQLWTLDFTDFEQKSLNKKIGLYHSLFYQLEFLKQYAKTDFERAFIPVLEHCFSDMKPYSGAYIFDLAQFEVQRSSVANYYKADEEMKVLRLEENQVVFQLDYDGEVLLYLDVNDPTFREILWTHFSTSPDKADLKKIFKEGVKVDMPTALLNHMVEEASVPVLQVYFDDRLQPVYDFLVEQGQALDLKPNSFLSDYYFMIEDGKFYSYLLSNFCEGSACGELGESYACKVDLSANVAKLSLREMLEQITGVIHMLQSHLLEYFYAGDHKTRFNELNSKVKIDSGFDINTFFYGGKGLVRFESGRVIPDGKYSFTMQFGRDKQNLARVSTEYLDIDSYGNNSKFWTNQEVSLVSYMEEFYIERGYHDQLKADALAKLKEIKKQCKLIGLPYKLGEVFNECRLSKSR